MKKRVILITLVLICALALSACGCKHETWIEANCETAKTCAECGKTEGVPLGHSWLAATCDTAKTCEVCGLAEGEPKGHAWKDATCEEPKTCEVCGLIEGEALGHAWKDATTEAPKTCETCGLAEGERIITDPRFTTAATIDYQGKWEYRFDIPGENLNVEGFEKDINCVLYMELRGDGTGTSRAVFADPEAFKADFADALVRFMYDQLAASGANEEQADALMIAYYGMGVVDYVAKTVEESGIDTWLDDVSRDQVYYVEDGVMYFADSWDGEMSKNYVKRDGENLIVEADYSYFGIEEDSVTFTRVVEEG